MTGLAEALRRAAYVRALQGIDYDDEAGRRMATSPAERRSS